MMITRTVVTIMNSIIALELVAMTIVVSVSAGVTVGRPVVLVTIAK